MKKFLFSILILSFCVSGIYAQSDSYVKHSEEYYCKALEQYLFCLNHQNDGVVESAIVNLMRMRRHCPNILYQTTIDRLNDLTANGRTENIRLLALLAARYIQDSEDPALFADINVENHEQLVLVLLKRLL